MGPAPTLYCNQMDSTASYLRIGIIHVNLLLLMAFFSECVLSLKCTFVVFYCLICPGAMFTSNSSEAFFFFASLQHLELGVIREKAAGDFVLTAPAFLALLWKKRSYLLSPTQWFSWNHAFICLFIYSLDKQLLRVECSWPGFASWLHHLLTRKT